MSKTAHLIHQATLKNNCPECFATNGIKISFYQEEKENAVQTKASNMIKTALQCQTCHSYIYPIQYTEDIERVYEYHYKQALPLKRKSKWKPLAFVLLLLLICAFSICVYFILG